MGDRRRYPRQRAVEFRKFLWIIDATVPPDLEIHLVLANRWTHKTAMIHDWLAMHLHFRLHLTPTSAWWVNRVERWFADLTERRIRRETHRSTQDLEAAIEGH